MEVKKKLKTLFINLSAGDCSTSRRLLREKRGTGDPAGACAEEAPGPPAESEDLCGNRQPYTKPFIN